VITWYKGKRILSAGSLKILAEPRFTIVQESDGINVLIQKVKMEDKDNYVCEVNLKDKPIRIKHQLEVLGELKLISRLNLNQQRWSANNQSGKFV
jgi:hypothetical protein